MRIDVTNVLAFWATDSVAPTTLALRQVPEGAMFTELRLHGSGDVAQRPTLHITYAPRYPVKP